MADNKVILEGQQVARIEDVPDTSVPLIGRGAGAGIAGSGRSSTALTHLAC